MFNEELFLREVQQYILQKKEEGSRSDFFVNYYNGCKSGAKYILFLYMLYHEKAEINKL